MKVYLVRHGDADAEIPEGLDDAARALTSRARQSLPVHFAGLVHHFGVPHLIAMSPLVRAVQTATLLAQALGYEGPLRTSRALLPNGPVGAIETFLSGQEGERVVLVGHQPSMGAAAAHFLGENAFPRPVLPGTVIGIDRPGDALSARLILYAAPGQPVAESL